MKSPTDEALPTALHPLMAALAAARSGGEADELLDQATLSISGFQELQLTFYGYGDLVFNSGLHMDSYCRSLRMVGRFGITCAPRFVCQIAYPDGCSVVVEQLPGTEFCRLVRFRTLEATLPAAVAVRFWEEMATLLECGWVNYVAPRWGTMPLRVDPANYTAYLLDGWGGLLDVTALPADDLEAYRTRIHEQLARALDLARGLQPDEVRPWHP